MGWVGLRTPPEEESNWKKKGERAKEGEKAHGCARTENREQRERERRRKGVAQDKRGDRQRGGEEKETETEKDERQREHDSRKNFKEQREEQ